MISTCPKSSQPLLHMHCFWSTSGERQRVTCISEGQVRIWQTPKITWLPPHPTTKTDVINDAETRCCQGILFCVASWTASTKWLTFVSGRTPVCQPWVQFPHSFYSPKYMACAFQGIPRCRDLLIVHNLQKVTGLFLVFCLGLKCLIALLSWVPATCQAQNMGEFIIQRAVVLKKKKGT